jgi:hypothetical protein
MDGSIRFDILTEMEAHSKNLDEEMKDEEFKDSLILSIDNKLD